MTSRIFWKLYLGFTLVILISAATVWVVASQRAKRQGLRQVEDMLTVRASMLSHHCRASLGAGVALQDTVASLGEAADTRLTVIRADGVVLADSWEDPAVMENHSRRPEVLAAGKTRGAGTSTRHSRTVHRDMMYLALPILRGETIEAYARAALPLTSVEQRLAVVRASVALGAAIAAVVGLLLGLFVSRAFTRPLSHMTRVAGEIASGGYGQRIDATSRDELGQLGSALQQMSEQLDERLNSLTQERNELLAVLSSMQEGVIAVDGEERVVHMNDMAADLLATSAEASTGQRIWEVTRIQEVCDALAHVLEHDSDHAGEFGVLAGNGERVLEMRVTPLRDRKAQTTGAVLVLHDVTRLRKLETVRREFVSNVSHELKTPLTAIRGFVETLLDDEDVDPETREHFLTRMKDQAVRLSTLVTDLLVLSRVESEEGALERRALDLRDPLADSASRLAADATGKSVEFAFEPPGEPVRIVGDEEALRQVVDNLLDNALKYTPDGGSVTLSLGTSKGTAVIEVVDTGIGIEPTHQDRIFERFYRVDKARSREIGGTGLGLSIVKNIVEAHGGCVSVESEPGRGSTFRVRLPLHQAP
jgi:two-component system phosphate regulon sensor histidine kinase PhoR